MRDGSRIRVHAQLIRAASDEHFWSESYDRELRDVLAMEADVAQAVGAKRAITTYLDGTAATQYLPRYAPESTL